MNAAQGRPALAGSERDSDGRLVGLDFDSTPPLKAPDANPWLIALDSSDNALRAVTCAAGQAAGMNACALHGGAVRAAVPPAPTFSQPQRRLK